MKTIEALNELQKVFLGDPNSAGRERCVVHNSGLEPALLQNELGEITTDSRRVLAGSCFLAIRGSTSDGHAYLAEVCSRNPALVVVEDFAKVPAGYKGIVVEVENTRRAWAAIAAAEFGQPSKSILMVGITGTNGKTSCTCFFEHLLTKLGYPCGVIGTIDHHLGNRVWKTSATTPNPLDLQKRLQEMKEIGGRAVAMEVSSHALDQHRVDQVHFDVALFTNLTRDHLDYHKTMEEYFAAKQRLFTDLLWDSVKPMPVAVVNIDDEWGRRMRVAQKAGLVTFGKMEGGNPADWRYKITKADFNFTEFHVHKGGVEFDVRLPMVGDHQVANAVAVLASVHALNERHQPGALDLRRLGTLLEDFPGVPGRLEKVPHARGFHVFVDYAHSPDALENTLRSLRQIQQKGALASRILTVFGCGGDRDTGKRPLMAKIAEQWSDHVIVTSDNPRSEVPEKILADINEGFSANARGRFESIVDRRAAIARALQWAKKDDVILIAGKGHEDYQEIQGQRFTFRDQDVVKELLS